MGEMPPPKHSDWTSALKSTGKERDGSPLPSKHRSTNRLREVGDVAEHPLPQGRFTGMAVLNQTLPDLLVRGLDNLMPRIARKVRTDGARHRPTSPRAPATLFTTRLIHASSVVLKMHARITEKNTFGRMRDEPSHGGVRHWPLLQCRFVTVQIRAHRAVETKYRASCEPALP